MYSHGNQQNTHSDYRKTNYRRVATKPTEIVNELKVETLDVAPPIPPKRYLLQQRRMMEAQQLQAKKALRSESKYKLEQMKAGSFKFFHGQEPSKLASSISSSGSYIEKFTGMHYLVREYLQEGVHGVGVWALPPRN